MSGNLLSNFIRLSHSTLLCGVQADLCSCPSRLMEAAVPPHSISGNISSFQFYASLSGTKPWGSPGYTTGKSNRERGRILEANLGSTILPLILLTKLVVPAPPFPASIYSPQQPISSSWQPLTPSNHLVSTGQSNTILTSPSCLTWYGISFCFPTPTHTDHYMDWTTRGK